MYKKVTREQIASYLNTGTADLPQWAIIGVGITDYGQSYNPQVETEKWIIHKNATSSLESYQIQGDVSQKCYKGDDVFEFVHAGLDKLNYKSHILDIDMWNGTGSTYPAKKNDVIITVTNYMGENAEIEYDIYYDGDATVGTVTITDGVPSFSPTVSL